MIVFSLFTDDKKDDIKKYLPYVDDLICYLQDSGIRYQGNTFSQGIVSLYVLLIDSKTSKQINYLSNRFNLPKKYFKFIPGGKI